MDNIYREILLLFTLWNVTKYTRCKSSSLDVGYHIHFLGYSWSKTWDSWATMFSFFLLPASRKSCIVARFTGYGISLCRIMWPIYWSFLALTATKTSLYFFVPWIIIVFGIFSVQRTLNTRLHSHISTTQGVW